MHRMVNPELSFRRYSRSGRVLSLVTAAALVSSWSDDAEAHFRLVSPPPWIVEDGLGNPQKVSPCGGDGDNVEPTGVVTTYRAGSVISVEWQETVAHPGHFRISLARDRAELVNPPVVTTGGDGLTGLSISAQIATNPVAPVLADGLFARAGSPMVEEEPFRAAVQLPDETCEKCTLQVIQFMSDHLPSYFYHHCADIRIVAADAELDVEPSGVLDPSVLDGASGAGAPLSGAGAGGDGSGGGCSLALASRSPGSGGAALLVLLLGLGAAVARRRSA